MLSRALTSNATNIVQVSENRTNSNGKSRTTDSCFVSVLNSGKAVTDGS